MKTNRSVRSIAVRLTTLAFAVLVIHPRPGHAQGAQTPAPTPPSPAAQAAATTAAPGPTLALSMDDAVAMALETNLGLKGQRLNVDIAAQSIAGARAAFLPFVQSGISRNSSESAPQKLPDGTSVVPSSASISGSGTFAQSLRWYGGQYSLRWQANRDTSAGSGSTFNPRLGSTFVVNFVQPLWRDFRIDQNRASLQRAERQRVIADIDLQQQIVGMEVQVKRSYFNLIASIQGREVAQQNMDLAEQSLANARARVAVGQSAQIDIITTEAQVESFRDSLIQADAQISTSEDLLRSLILDPARPDYWQVSLKPTDEIQVTARQVDEAAVIQNALANRLDLIAAKRGREITTLNLDLAHNATKPTVNANVTYSASGSGGTQLIDGLPSVRGFGTVLGDAFGGAYPSWTVGATFAYPLGRSAAVASVAQGQLQAQQEDLQIRQLELDIVAAVRDAVRAVRTSQQRVQATHASLEANQRQLDAEERKNAVGLTDTFQLQQRQLQLAQARVSELNAKIAYNNALIQLDRVQKIR